MMTVLVRGEPSWVDQLDELGERLGLPRTAVIERAVAMLARSEALRPEPRMGRSKFHPWLGDACHHRQVECAAVPTIGQPEGEGQASRDRDSCTSPRSRRG